jgi:hypothetical protein
MMKRGKAMYKQLRTWIAAATGSFRAGTARSIGTKRRTGMQALESLDVQKAPPTCDRGLMS